MFTFLKDILYYPLLEQDDFQLAPVNLLIFLALFILGKIVIKYLKRFFKSQELVEKKFTLEGKEIPFWRLVKQLVWLGVFFLGIKSLEVNNPELKSSHILQYEFLRFKDFHIAVYHLFVAIFIIFSSRIVLSFFRIYLQRRLRRKGQTDEGTTYVYLQLTKYIIVVLAIIFMLRSMGVDLNLFITSMAFLLVGLGLGLQDIFRDFFAGLLLLFEGSVKVGDIVEIERLKDNEENFVAKILEINIRTSRVETRDGKMLIIPNSHLTFEKVNNWTSGEQLTRFMIPVEVQFGEDLDLVKSVLLKCAQEHPMVDKSKDVIVRLLDFGDNGYKLDVVFWAKKNFFIEIHKSDIRFAIDHEFRKHGINYPYNQLDIHMVDPEKATPFHKEDEDEA